ncbi:isoprenyl transferase [Sunxiuqinia elliptica]|uniref:Isoprenyl transferase n=1 Tax=Sunxiuqinia elliptica TaxID=655355 RepID=A0A4R6GN96_9BACT|nr:isoprenyl transferase [Sunxiuqinia elliptica]TDN96701.1 undecaprenyl diphosphate synthase [Sunxiuqinia elliptica]TDO55740.1 undecaprenyl diphosphate synthase [Sunxiuqinia elliptica]
MTAKEKIQKSNLPKHIAIIMDGNGRWAAKQGNERAFGHEHGVDAVRSAVEGAVEVGLQYLTLYAFSTENWSRPQDEVTALMGLLVQAITDETEKLKEQNVRLAMIGDLASLPEEVQEKLNWSINKLKDSTGLTLVLALSYSSKWEITQAIRQIATDVKEGTLTIDEINNNLLDKYLATNGIPDPELLIRTSGETRISNFLLWQIAYAELYFTPVLWPDFRKENLFEAICDFQNRERRFGKTSQQLVS